MNRLASHALALEAAAACDWPRVSIEARGIGTFTVEGERRWREAVARSTPADRLSLVVSLAPALLSSTPGGRERLEAAAAPRCEGDEIDPDPSYYGDPELLDTVRAALALVPDLVAFTALKEVAFVGVGVSSRAWISSSSFVDCVGRGKPRLIALGPSADVGTVLHELAHLHLAGPPREFSIAVSAEGERRFLALTATKPWGEELDDTRALGEVLADACALAWLFGREAGRLA